MQHTSYIEISDSAVENNIAFIREILGDDVIFSSVVKGNAYGHGIETYCPLAYKHGIRHFSVADANEAYALTQCFPSNDITIMIMGMIDDDQIDWAIEKGIEFYVFNTERLESTINAARKAGTSAKIHLELETGMNRTGIESKNLARTLSMVEEDPDLLDIKGICTHLAGAESIANYKRITDQQKKFRRLKTQLEKHEWLKPLYHMASSAASLRYPKSRYDLARIGILQYGFFPTREIQVQYQSKKKQYNNPLIRVVSWKTKVMDVKTIKAGQFVGYGTSYFTNVDTKIAIIPVGYSSGYSRSLSNRGKVLIKGMRYDVIGTVNMNMMVVEITTADNIEKGDEVVLIGDQGEMEMTVSSFSDYSHLINYELLTRLPRNIPRIITN